MREMMHVGETRVFSVCVIIVRVMNYRLELKTQRNESILINNIIITQ